MNAGLNFTKSKFKELNSNKKYYRIRIINPNWEKVMYILYHLPTKHNLHL